MKILIEKEIETCAECPNLQAYKKCNPSGTRTQREMNWRCMVSQKEISVGMEPEATVPIPDWCPAATYNAAKVKNKVAAVKVSNKVARVNGTERSVPKQ